MLPPFESVVQLTAAHLPPKQQGAQTVDGEAEVEMRGESEAGHMLEDGHGTLADGSTWERISGEEFDDNGYWCRCDTLSASQSRVLASALLLMSACTLMAQWYRSIVDHCCITLTGSGNRLLNKRCRCCSQLG